MEKSNQRNDRGGHSLNHLRSKVVSAGVLCCMMCVLSTASAAPVGTWRNYTAMKEIRSLSSDGVRVWGATSGGLFAWEVESTQFLTFTNAEGLRSNDLFSVAVDNDGDIWTGSSTGFIHVYSPTSQSWRYILDITTSPQTNKRINRFRIQGDTILICSEFGLSVFHKSAFRFGDTYTKFGSLPTTTRVAVSSAVIFNNSIWAAIKGGLNDNFVAVASLSNPNLLPPSSWTLQSVGGGIPRELVVFNERLYCAASSGLYFFDGSSWSEVPGLTGLSLLTATRAGNVLYVSTSSQVYTVDAQNIITSFGPTLPAPPTSATSDISSRPFLGTGGGGILRESNGMWQSFAPNGPNSNQFISVAVDPDGRVWGASGFNGGGKGVYRLDANGWKSFTRASAGLPTDDYFRVSVGCEGSVWISSWGNGVAEIPRGTDRVDSSRLFGNNVGMVGFGDPRFLVISGVVCDHAGNHWMTINNANDMNIMVVRKPDGSWTTRPLIYNLNRVTTLLDNIPVDRSFAVDASGNLWVVSRDGAVKGVFSLNNRGAVSDTVRFLLNADNGLPSNDIRTIVVDRDNDVWIGTDRGIAIVLDPDRPNRSGAVAAYRPLNGLVINSIAVDPLNQKWVATPEGVILLSRDGTQVLATYTVESTGGKLIDNDVKSIAIDSKTGTVYFGTANGLASLTTPGSAPKAAFEDLAFSPNPYIVPNPTLLTVDGLVENSSLKILSIDGRLVRALNTPGGRIGFWDGRDETGQFVSTGVYIVIAYSEDGSKVTTGKVAIVRR